MTYNPFTKSYRLEADTSVNYIMIFRRGECPGLLCARRQGGPVRFDARSRIPPSISPVLSIVFAPIVRCRRCRSSARPHASHGARGMLGAAFGSAREPRLRAPSRRFLDYYAAALCEKTKLFEDGKRFWRRRASGFALGIVTNKAHVHAADPERLALSARTVAVICGDTTPTQSRTRTVSRGGAGAESRAFRLRVRGDAERTSSPARRSMKTLIASYGYLGADDRRNIGRRRRHPSSGAARLAAGDGGGHAMAE